VCRLEDLEILSPRELLRCSSTASTAVSGAAWLGGYVTAAALRAEVGALLRARDGRLAVAEAASALGVSRESARAAALALCGEPPVASADALARAGVAGGEAVGLLGGGGGHDEELWTWDAVERRFLDPLRRDAAAASTAIDVAAVARRAGVPMGLGRAALGAVLRRAAADSTDALAGAILRTAGEKGGEKTGALALWPRAVTDRILSLSLPLLVGASLPVSLAPVAAAAAAGIPTGGGGVNAALLAEILAAGGPNVPPGRVEGAGAGLRWAPRSASGAAAVSAVAARLEAADGVATWTTVHGWGGLALPGVDGDRDRLAALLAAEDGSHGPALALPGCLVSGSALARARAGAAAAAAAGPGAPPLPLRSALGLPAAATLSDTDLARLMAMIGEPLRRPPMKGSDGGGASPLCAPPPPAEPSWLVGADAGAVCWVLGGGAWAASTGAVARRARRLADLARRGGGADAKADAEADDEAWAAAALARAEPGLASPSTTSDCRGAASTTTAAAALAEALSGHAGLHRRWARRAATPEAVGARAEAARAARLALAAATAEAEAAGEAAEAAIAAAVGEGGPAAAVALRAASLARAGPAAAGALLVVAALRARVVGGADAPAALAAWGAGSTSDPVPPPLPAFADIAQALCEFGGSAGARAARQAETVAARAVAVGCDDGPATAAAWAAEARASGVDLGLSSCTDAVSPVARAEATHSLGVRSGPALEAVLRSAADDDHVCSSDDASEGSSSDPSAWLAAAALLTLLRSGGGCPIPSVSGEGAAATPRAAVPLLVAAARSRAEPNAAAALGRLAVATVRWLRSSRSDPDAARTQRANAAEAVGALLAAMPAGGGG